MNNDVVNFDFVKIRILCYDSFVNDRENNFLLIKKMNKCFREMHKENFKN